MVEQGQAQGKAPPAQQQEIATTRAQKTRRLRMRWQRRGAKGKTWQPLHRDREEYAQKGEKTPWPRSIRISRGRGRPGDNVAIATLKARSRPKVKAAYPTRLRS